MGTELVTINNAAVIRDSTKTWRWLAAFGPSVTAWEFNPNEIPLASTTALSGYTHTAATSGNMTLTAGADGGEFVITAGAGDNQGGQIQRDTEGFYFAQGWLCYFGACWAVNDADQTDNYLGLAITDTSAATAVSDGIGFFSVDESTDLYLSVCKNYSGTTGISNTIVATLADATFVITEFYFDGTTLTAYVNGTEAGSLAYSSSAFPNDEYLTPTIAFLTGAAAANTLKVKWARAFQVRET